MARYFTPKSISRGVPRVLFRRRGCDGLNSGARAGHERRLREVSVTEQKYYRKGFKMRDNVQHLLDRDYRSEVVDSVRKNGNVFEADRSEERRVGKECRSRWS